MSGPSRLNWVSVLMTLLLAAAGYGGWKFFPVYMTSWQVDHALGDACAEAFHVDAFAEPQRSERLRAIEEKTQQRVAALGITDPELTLHVEIADGAVAATCDYRVVVEHPWVNRQTIVPMHRQAKTSLQRKMW